jgi:hypothetical protein
VIKVPANVSRGSVQIPSLSQSRTEQASMRIPNKLLMILRREIRTGHYKRINPNAKMLRVIPWISDVWKVLFVNPTGEPEYEMIYVSYDEYPTDHNGLPIEWVVSPDTKRNSNEQD